MAITDKLLKRSSRFASETGDALSDASQCVQKSLSRPATKRAGMILLAIVGIGLLYWATPEIARYVKMERM